jgi:integrase
MKKENFKGGWKKMLADLLRTQGKYSANSKKAVSFATQQARKEHLFKIVKDIRNLGFKINNLYNLKNKHINALVNHYAGLLKQNNMAVNTIHNRLCHLHVLLRWIGKDVLIKPISDYKNLPAKRSSVAEVSKAWSDNNVDVNKLIEQVRAKSERFADALNLQKLFGLRSKESLLFKPHLADNSTYLNITHGTKGGRDRTIPIETPEQRQLLDKLKSYIGKNDSLIPRGVKYVNFRRTYYRTLKQSGICRAEGVTPHGLRHEHLNNLYEQVTGSKSAVHGGKLHKENSELDSYGRTLVAERAGHSRETIASAYIGGKR